MMSSSLGGASRTDSTSESWLQSYGKSQSVDPTSAAGGSILFESLFTAEFFRSSISNNKGSGAGPATDASSSSSVNPQAGSDQQVASDSQASDTQTNDTNDSERNYGKLLFGGPRLNDQKSNQPVGLTKKKDDEKDSKKRDDAPAVVPYCPPPAFNPSSNTNQSKDPTQSATITKNPDGDKVATNKSPLSEVKSGSADQVANHSVQNTQSAVSSGLDAKQDTTGKQEKPEVHQDNKSAIGSDESQKVSTSTDTSTSTNSPTSKTEPRLNQFANNEHGEKLKPQQVEKSETQQDKGERDRPQSRRAERLEENRVDQKSDSVGTTDTTNQASQATDQSQVQDQSQIQDLVAEMTATSPSADTALVEVLSSVPSIDASSTVTSVTDVASMAAASASAIASTTTVAIASSAASAASAVAATTDVAATSSIIAASAVSQPATLPKTDSTDTSSAASQVSTPVSTEPLTEYQQSRLMQRVLKGLERLDDNSSTIRLRLHPPELGALEMSLHVNQQQLSASINVDSEATRQVLQDNLPQLQSKLAERGITLEKFDIQVQSTVNTDSQGSSFNQQQPGFGSGGSWSGESGQGRAFGEARWNQIRPPVSDNADAAQSSHMSRYYSGQNLNLHA